MMTKAVYMVIRVAVWVAKGDSVRRKVICN